MSNSARRPAAPPDENMVVSDAAEADPLQQGECGPHQQEAAEQKGSLRSWALRACHTPQRVGVHPAAAATPLQG